MSFQPSAYLFPSVRREPPEIATETRRALARIFLADASPGANRVSDRIKKPRRYLCRKRF